MTPEQLDEIERLAEAATPGLWVAERDAALSTAMREHALPLVKALRDARALLAALKAEHRPADEVRSQLLAEVEAHAETRFKFARQIDWYQQRFNALRAWVGHEVAPLSDAVAQKYWNIVANGSPSPHESADWAGTMHAAILRADIAEGRLRTEIEAHAETKAEVERLREIVKTAGDRLRACAHQLTEHAYQEMADALFDLPASAEAALKEGDR